MIEKLQGWTEEMMLKHEEDYSLEYVGNAHHYFSAFIRTSDENRRTINPHNINGDLMLQKFGEPNFQDDYKGSDWWILSYKGNTWAVDTNEREGSGIWRFYDDKVNRMFDKQHSKEMGEFVNDLYNVLI